MRRERDSRDMLDNWHQDALCVELEVTDRVQIRQTRVECPWCDKKHFVVVRNGQQVTGIHVCGSCGQLFRWTVLDEVCRMRRVRGKLKFRIDPSPGEE